MRSTPLPHRKCGFDSATGRNVLANAATAKAILVCPALGTQVGIMAKLPSSRHIIGVVLGGLREGGIHSMRPKSNPPANVIAPHQHGKQGRMAVEGSLLHRRLR